MQSTYSHKDLLDARVHLGHQRRKWNPKMAKYIYTESEGIHIIDLNKTLEKLDKASNYLRNVAKSGKKILFVATKKQAKQTVKNFAEELGIFHVTERWLGGMLTNFVTIRKSVKKMQQIERTLGDTEVNALTKKEKLTMSRDKDKIGKVLGGVSQLNSIPGCVVIADIIDEHIALAEAKKLKIPVVAIVDTNCNPDLVDFPIPANDDSSHSIEIIFRQLSKAIKEGLEERKSVQASEIVEEETTLADDDNRKGKPNASERGFEKPGYRTMRKKTSSAGPRTPRK